MNLTPNMHVLLKQLGCSRQDIEGFHDEEKILRKHVIPYRTMDSWDVYNFPVYCIIRALHPRVSVEAGVAGGQTTSAILSALTKNACMHKNGVLHSIDPINQSNHWSRNHVLLDWSFITFIIPNWSFIKGTTKENLPTLIETMKQHGHQVDFFFHDSEHTDENILFEFRAIKEIASPDCLFGLHDPHPHELEDEFTFLGGDPTPRFRAFVTGGMT